MTRQQANQHGVHFKCGGRLQTAQRQIEGKSIWMVGVRCTKCHRKVISRVPYRRALQGEEAKADRRYEAIKSFNAGAPWEQDD